MTQTETASNQADPADPAEIDWSDIHRRIAAAQIAQEGAAAETPMAKKNLLRTRAKVLAHTRGTTAAPGETIEVIEFLLAHERYGLETRFVREVYPLRELTPLPGTPPFVLGLVNVRGQILSVVDLKRFFDLPDRGLTDLNRIIILDSGPMVFGILADVIFGVQRIPMSELQPSLPTLTGIRDEFLKGVTRQRVIILAAEKLLTSPELIIREDVEA